MSLPTPPSTLPPQTDDSSPGPITKPRSSTAVRVSISSGPAVNTADARKNKKKRGKLANQTDELRDATDPGMDTPHPTPLTAPVIPLPDSSHPAPPEENHGYTPTYPPSDQGRTPPPIAMPNFHDERPLSPIPSPTRYPRTIRIPPRHLAHPMDYDVNMAPPNAVLDSPSTPTRPPPATTANQDQIPPLVDNALGLTLPPPPPPQPLKLSSLSERLEEDAIDKSTATGRNQAQNALDKYSDGPMPPIQDSSPTAIFQHIDLNLIRDWENRPGGKLIAIPFDMDVLNLDSHEFFRTRILTAVAEITNAQEASVAAPRPTKEATRSNKSPTAFLIYNISPEQSNLLLQRKVWSSRATTFRVAPFATSCPTFLFAIKGYATISLRDIFPIVKDVWTSENTRTYADTLLDAVPPAERTKVKTEIENFLGSMNIIRLDIREAGNTLKPRFNVYAEGGTLTYDKLWSKLRHFLFNCTYATSMEGRGITEKIPFICTCCHGVDHPRGLCPFPDLPGWNGPTRDNGGDPSRRRNGDSPFRDQRSQRQKYILRT